jgi:hypothetical protein
MTVMMDEELSSDGDVDCGEEALHDADRDLASSTVKDAIDEKDAAVEDANERDAIGDDSHPDGEVRSIPDRAADETHASLADLAQSMATLRASRGGVRNGEEDEEIAHGEHIRQDPGTLASAGSADRNGTVEDYDDEEEPSLKYSRLRGSVPDMLKKDSASALAVSDRFLALGTHGGSIYILDEQGNLIKGFRTHSASVLALAIDSTSEFVGSAGMDGIVSVAALSSAEAYSFDFKRVMRSIALEPGFGWRSSRSFVTGGMAGQLVLREKSWFGHRESILHEGEGPIWTTQWRGNYIAWASDRGVRIYDVNSKQRITFISPPKDKPRADLYRCSLVWQDDNTLLVAWGDTIKVVKIRQREAPSKIVGANVLASTSSTKPVVEIVSILQLDCMISGIAPRGGDFLILAYIEDDDEDDEDGEPNNGPNGPEAQRPEWRLISADGEELSSDVLSLQGYSRFRCNDYLLVPSYEAIQNGALAIASNDNSKMAKSTDAKADSDYFYVVSPRDIVIARSRDQKDHIDWLLQHRHFDEALAIVNTMAPQEAVVDGFDANAIGAQYLTYLMHDKHDWQKAASVAPDILKNNAQAWEDVVLAFVEHKALSHLIQSIPTSDPILNIVIYDMILAQLMGSDPAMLLVTIRSWPVTIYSTQAVVLALEDKLGERLDASNVDEQYKADAVPGEVKKMLMECVAEIHLRNRQPGRALPYYLRLRKSDVFDLIRNNNLFTDVRDQALLLVEFEEDLRQSSSEAVVDARWQSIDLLVDHTHSIPIHRVVAQLQNGKRLFLHIYLDALFDRDPHLTSPYSDLQVELYATYEPVKLMSYLRSMSSYYSFEKAYSVCKQLDFVPEMVFLLSRIGDKKTALMLIIERLGDVERAISFVKEEKDPDLWDNLVHYSEDKPKFIRGLLENVGGEVDAVRLIRRIKDGLHIEGLREALIKILGDFNLQISLLEGSARILTHDVQRHITRLNRGQTEGIFGEADGLCAACNKSLLSSSSSGAQTTKVDDETTDVSSVAAIFFLCRHAYHLSCLVSNTASIPKRSTVKALERQADAEQDAHSAAGLLVTMTTTRALATNALYSAAVFGPMQRARTHERKVQDKIRYEARLRVVLKKGCPACHADDDKGLA